MLNGIKVIPHIRRLQRRRSFGMFQIMDFIGLVSTLALLHEFLTAKDE